MLTDLFKVLKRIFQSSTYCGHPTERCAFELLALEERGCIFDEANVITRDGLDEVFGRGKSPQRNSKVVSIVEGVEEVLVC